MDELDRHMMACEFSVTGSDSTESKVNILLQTYISKQIVDNFSLVSDMSYVAQVINTDYSCSWIVTYLLLLEFSQAIFLIFTVLVY